MFKIIVIGCKEGKFEQNAINFWCTKKVHNNDINNTGIFIGKLALESMDDKVDLIRRFDSDSSPYQ